MIFTKINLPDLKNETVDFKQDNQSTTFFTTQYKLSAIKVYVKNDLGEISTRISSKNSEKRYLKATSEIEKQHPPFNEMYYYLNFPSIKSEIGEKIELIVLAQDEKQIEQIEVSKIKLFYETNILSAVSNYLEKVINSNTVINQNIIIMLLIATIFIVVKILSELLKILKNSNHF